MSYSYLYLGSADVDEDTLARWLAVKLDAVDAQPIRMLGWGLEASGHYTTVGDVFEDVARWRGATVELGPPTRLFVTAEKDGDAWLTYRGDVALAFLALHDVGGCGRLEVVGDESGPDGGYRVATTPELDVRELDEDDAWKVRERMHREHR